MEVVRGHLTPCMSLRAAVNLHNLQGIDPDFGRMISEIIFLGSLIFFLHRYMFITSHPLWKEFMCVLNFLIIVFFFPENSSFRASPGALKNVFLKWQSPNCFGTTGAKQTGSHPDP